MINKNHDDRISKLLNEKIIQLNGNDIHDKFNTLVNCKCCIRHNIQKPRYLQFYYETPFSFYNKSKCKCDCRHFSRALCRFYCGSINLY